MARKSIAEMVAKSLNAGGSAVISAFDAGTAAFNCTMSALSPGERSKLDIRIKLLENKIQALYRDIGKETSTYQDPTMALESKFVTSTVSAIRNIEYEIGQMRCRIAEIDAINKQNKPNQEKIDITDAILNSLSGFLPGEKFNVRPGVVKQVVTSPFKIVMQ